MDIQSISILGCGWLGLSLAVHFRTSGWQVKGSTTRREKLEGLSAAQIEAYQIILTPEIQGNVDDFLNSNILIINIPPQRRPDIIEYHSAQMEALLAAVESSEIQKVLFISSTSVYPNLNREVTETETRPPEKASGKVLKKIEQRLLAHPQLQTGIIRFGGLIGGERRPGKFLAGKKNIPGGDAPINLIHRDDCIALIAALVQKNVWGEIFNACADQHPTRREYYTAAAQALNIPAPDFEDNSQTAFKIVNSEKIKRCLNYQFIHPDPLRVL